MMTPTVPVEHVSVVRSLLLDGLGSGLVAFGLLLACLAFALVVYGAIAVGVSRLGR